MKPVELTSEQLDKKEIEALRNLRKGEATAGQQKLALVTIINKFTRVHDVLYVPNDTHASTFLQGRAFVGAAIMKHLNAPIGALTIDGVKPDVPATTQTTK